ncbi:GTP-binding protein [Sulfurimonas sp. SAG-AH-194-L11]|nr:Rab family GTPase [Sulfurimonas sp. SAG-AH-194-L11]MDF1876329.1 GTP-binding protein [Sulfurimonas sp. SAG-AH-194-L11]
MITKKIILIGDFSTGKTSLIRQFVDNQFSDEYLTTIGVKISKKIINIQEDLEIQLLVWDIEGQTDVKAINPAYVMGAHGVIIVADLTRQKSIVNIKEHLALSSKIIKNAPVIIALNKSDLLDNSSKIETTITEIKSSYSNISHIYPTSAKTGLNVELIFQNITKSILKI